LRNIFYIVSKRSQNKQHHTKKDSSKEKTGFNIYLMHKKYCKTTSIYEGIHQIKYQHTI